MPAPSVAVLCRAPRPGRAKTRLCPPLAPDVAAALALAFLLDVLDALRSPGWDLEACVAAPADVPLVRALVPAGTVVSAQPPGDLGARMRGVVVERRAAGRPATVLVGADCPTIDAARVEGALRALREGADAALCPSADGGYGLLALARPHAALFRGVPWSTPEVLAVTRARARDAGLTLAELDPLDDVDRVEDLARLMRALDAGPAGVAPRTAHALHGLMPTSPS